MLRITEESKHGNIFFPRFPWFNFTFKMSGEVLILDDRLSSLVCEVLIFTVRTIIAYLIN